MRIVHIINNFNPILGYQETYVAREQSKLGHEVYVITSDRHFKPDFSVNKSLFDNNLRPGFYIEEGIQVWKLKTLIELPYNQWLLGLESKIEDLKPDIVHVHMVCTFNSIRTTFLKQKKKNFKLILDDHMSPGGSQSRLGILYPFFKFIFSKFIQNNADALVGVAPVCKKFMHEKYGFQLKRIKMIPLGADPNLFKFNLDARREIRNNFSIDEEDVVFIYTGKVTPRKGPHILIEAAIKLSQKYNNIKIILIGGEGSKLYVEKIKKIIKEGNMENKVILHDVVPHKELHKYYSASDVAVWPKECSLSTLEANACSLPVIVSDTMETPERVSYANGLMYHNFDPSELARQMEILLDTKLREQMGKNGRRIIEEKFNWTVIANQFIDIVQATL